MTDNLNELERIKREYERRGKETSSKVYSSSHPGNRAMVESRDRAVAALLKKENILSLSSKKILEIGCGKGGWFNFLKTIGARESQLAGIDLIEDRVQAAHRQFPAADIRIGDASQLPWSNASFDLVIQSTVFTSILDFSLKQKIAGEMLRVLKNDGIIFWYDFFVDNPWNSNVEGVGSLEIDRLFNGCEIQLEKITLAPPLARFLAPITERLCFAFEKIKLFNTHYLGVIKKR